VIRPALIYILLDSLCNNDFTANVDYMESTMTDALGWVQKKVFMAYPSICLEELKKVLKMYQATRQRMKCKILNKDKRPKCSIHDL
jgi:hypothetical protein